MFISSFHEKKDSKIIILSIEDATELIRLAQFLVEESNKKIKKTPS